MCEQLLANPLIESYEIELRVASPQPRIGVVTYPGLAGRPGRALGARRARRRGGAGLARGARAARRSTRSCSRAASRTATTSAAARSRASRRRRRRCASSPTAAGSCSGSATASRSSARRACCRARCCGTSRSASSAATSPLRVERTDTPFTARCTAGQTLVIPVKHGDGRYVPPPDLDPGAGRAPLPRQPERLGRRHRRRLQRGRQRDGAHAAPRARGRSAARLRPTARFILASLVDAARDRALAGV